MNDKHHGWSKLCFIGIVGIVFSIFMMIIHGASWASTTPMIAGGDFHTITLKSDGTVWAWGYNSDGQSGDRTGDSEDECKLIPGQISGLSGVIAVAGAGRHTIALKSDGTAWAWGNNGDGQLGDGTTTGRATPGQVSGLSGIIAIACGEDHTIALKSDGTLWAWGYNGSGQLGDGTTNETYPYGTTTPVQVSKLSDVIAIACGALHTIALKSDGTVWAWGDNGYGQLGDGTYTSSNTPVQSIINLLKAGTSPCEALSLISETDKVICLNYYGKNETIVETVWVTALGSDCTMEGVEITATIVGIGKKLISISPKKASTDSNGQAGFEIIVKKKKKGAAKVAFKSGSLEKKIMTVKIQTECED